MEGNFSPARLFSKVLLTALLTTCVAFLEPFDLLYENAVQAFYDSDYDNVVRFMEGALRSHREVRSTRIRCRLRCQDQHQLGQIFSESRFFDAVIRRAACMDACVEKKLGSQSVHKVSEDVVQDFNRRIPYNYLQLAYQKVRGGQQVNYAGNSITRRTVSSREPADLLSTRESTLIRAPLIVDIHLILIWSDPF